MNDKVKMAATLLPVILVPLFNERKRIKEHPDMQKLGETSSTVYHVAKEKSTSAAESVKNAGTSTYQTGKSAVSKVGDAVSERRLQHTYKKDQKQYEQSLKQEAALLKQFEKEKEKHRKDRMKEQDESKMSVPKILQSGSAPDEEEKAQSMTVSDDYKEPETNSPETRAEKKSNPDNYGIAMEYESDQSHNRASLSPETNSPETRAEKKSNPDNYGIAMEYEGDQSHNRASLSDDDEERLDIEDEASQDQNNHEQKASDDQNNNEQERLDHMNQNINHWIEKKVRGHEEHGYENGRLFTEHKNTLDPRNAEAPNKRIEPDDSLFNQHRSLHESQMSSIGRKTGEPGAMRKSRKQKKLEKKINKHRRKQYKQ